MVAFDVGRGPNCTIALGRRRVEVQSGPTFAAWTPAHWVPPSTPLTCDLSFISLRTVMADRVGLVAVGASMVLLAKPQFEAGRAEVDRGSGVIRDPVVGERALVEISRSVLGHGAAIMEGMVSPLTGTDGNVEFLLHVREGAADDYRSTFDAPAVVALVDGGAA
ncbi:MAG: hypothetical protein Ct9H300mP12_00940 [Acidimicrobiales bacterium]|nr:MAG: hypothetical protein Ct9H300mP12_00940 [Acidimicrobiales bacterium]